MRKNYNKMIKVLFFAAIIILVVTLIKLKLLDLSLTKEDGPFSQMISQVNNISSRDYFPGQEVAILFMEAISFLGIFAVVAIYLLYIAAGIAGIAILLVECILILIVSALASTKNKKKWKEVLGDLILIFTSILHFTVIYLYIGFFTSFIAEIIVYAAVYIWCLYLYIKGKKDEKKDTTNIEGAAVIEEPKKISENSDSNN